MAGRGRGNPWSNSKHSNSVASAIKIKATPREAPANFASTEGAAQSYSSSEDDGDENNSGSIVGKVLQSYADSGGLSQDLGRTRLFLEEVFQSCSATCLICISNVGKNDAIWSCTLCFCFFHLNCLQQWAQQSIAQQKRALDEHLSGTPPDISWSCPKCRRNYQESEIPVRYICFCGKREDPPPYNGWSIPHSCGETCDRELSPFCGHRCMLLCHPGPCPPCPRQVYTSCQCGREPKRAVRCSAKEWSCAKPCGKVLPCSSTVVRPNSLHGSGRGKLMKKLNEGNASAVGEGVHLCLEICHAEPCPPCPRKSTQPCNCGKAASLRPCSDHEWKCEKACGQTLECGRHKCTVICHSVRDGCEPCPRSLPRKCPCGKSSFPGLTCNSDEVAEAVPTCGDTCGRMLPCGVHLCARRCHRDECGACLQMRVQTCRCGQHSKELPCQKEFLCENKCKRSRNCLRHACNRKCCDGNCPSCDKICSRTLSCGKHRCQAPCHRGPCYPCPLTVTLSCPCEATSVKVPCGHERRLKSKDGKIAGLKCRKPCMRPSECQHPPKKHICHSGNCPPCKEICGIVKKETCGHSCAATCHSSVWVEEDVKEKRQGPWEKPLFPKKVKKALPCPPCTFPVTVECLGGHEKNSQPCHSASRYSCGRECGRILSCQSHSCSFPCHLVKGVPKDIIPSAQAPAGRNCEECHNPCLKERPSGCSHCCIIQHCHPQDCPPCTQPVKQICHCGLTPALFIECRLWTAALEEEGGQRVTELLSCGNQCPKLLSCGHRCESTCHPGTCPSDVADSSGTSIECSQKVRVTCPCGRIKQRRMCKDVKSSKQNAQLMDIKGSKSLVLLECDQECQQCKDEETKQREASAERRRIQEEKKNAEEVLKFKMKVEGGGRRGRGRNKRNQAEEGLHLWKGYWITAIVILSAFSFGLIAYFLVNKD